MAGSSPLFVSRGTALKNCGTCCPPPGPIGGGKATGAGRVAGFGAALEFDLFRPRSAGYWLQFRWPHAIRKRQSFSRTGTSGRLRHGPGHGVSSGRTRREHHFALSSRFRARLMDPRRGEVCVHVGPSVRPPDRWVATPGGYPASPIRAPPVPTCRWPSSVWVEQSPAEMPRQAATHTQSQVRADKAVVRDTCRNRHRHPRNFKSSNAAVVRTEKGIDR